MIVSLLFLAKQLDDYYRDQLRTPYYKYRIKRLSYLTQ